VIRRVDRYELLEKVGTGGMASVYRGRDTALDREVAVKVLHPHLAERAESRARFSREARAVARLSHPHIVEIFDYSGDEASESYLVTEYVRGRTLRAFADEVGFAFPELGVLVARALADALAHAHAAGVIHRDLKPENVLVRESGARPAVKLTDFGIARILSSDERMTMTGALVGSPNHMAPEIIEGREAEIRSDVFSLGTLLYWLATGRMPFAASNPTATLRRILEADYEDPRQVAPLVSDRLRAVIDRSLASDPAGRYATAAEMKDALDEVLAEAGLDEPEEELAAFLADPAGYRQALRPRLVEALIARGDQAMEEGKAARALGFFDRVLALDAAEPRVLARLDRIRRRTRLARVARAAAVLAAGAAAVVLAYRLARPPEGRSVAERPASAAPVAPAPEPPRPREPAVAAADPAPPAVVESAPPPAAEPAAARRSPAVASSRPKAGPVPFAALVRPYAQRALLDGIEVARGETRVVFRIGPGLHTIRIEHACCTPFVREIGPEEAARLGEIKVPLAPRPARLRVEGDPSTRVYLGAALLGTAGDSQRTPLPVPVPAGSENPYEGQVELRLEREGEEPVAMPVKVRAGSDLTVAAARREVSP
jgi:serine/threonine-protein kinase